MQNAKSRPPSQRPREESLPSHGANELKLVELILHRVGFSLTNVMSPNMITSQSLIFTLLHKSKRLRLQHRGGVHRIVRLLDYSIIRAFSEF